MVWSLDAHVIGQEAYKITYHVFDLAVDGSSAVVGLNQLPANLYLHIHQMIQMILDLRSALNL